MANKRVVFHCWDWKEQPDFYAIRRGVYAVFDGSTAPCIVNVSEMLDWDQHTVAICSEQINTEQMKELLEKWRTDEDDRGDCSMDKIVPLEI